MYRIESDKFQLEFLPEIHEQDFAYPVNVYLGVKVSSYGYSVDSFMDVGVQGIADFAAQLKTFMSHCQEKQDWKNHTAFTITSSSLRKRVVTSESQDG